MRRFWVAVVAGCVAATLAGCGKSEPQGTITSININDTAVPVSSEQPQATTAQSSGSQSGDPNQSTSPGASGSSDASGTAAQSQSQSPAKLQVIDVRTPQEYSVSHVQGAINIDIDSPDFDKRIEGLAKPGKYVVYCRSGNRSAQAVEKMKAIGLDATNGGGLSAMQAAGYQFGS